jgi:O-methyltransferase
MDILVERVVPGGLVVLDDFCWLAYEPQRIAEIQWFQAHGHPALEPSTGQGLVVKR